MRPLWVGDGTAEMMITVNGESVSLGEGETVAALLARLGKSPKYLAVERNGELVPRARHGEVVLAAGDRVEIVTLVGGG